MIIVSRRLLRAKKMLLALKLRLYCITFTSALKCVFRLKTLLRPTVCGTEALIPLSPAVLAQLLSPGALRWSRLFIMPAKGKARARRACPSLDDSRPGAGFRGGGSGSSGFKVRPFARGGASGGWRGSVVSAPVDHAERHGRSAFPFTAVRIASRAGRSWRRRSPRTAPAPSGRQWQRGGPCPAGATARARIRTPWP